MSEYETFFFKENHKPIEKITVWNMRTDTLSTIKYIFYAVQIN